MSDLTNNAGEKPPMARWKKWSVIILGTILAIRVVNAVSDDGTKKPAAPVAVAASASSSAPAVAAPAASSSTTTCFDYSHFQSMIDRSEGLLRTPSSDPVMLKVTAMDSVIVIMLRNHIAPCEDWKVWWDDHIDTIRANPVFKRTEAAMTAR
jgi:hypothetical protein